MSKAKKVVAVVNAPVAPVSEGMSQLLAAIGGNATPALPAAKMSAKAFIRAQLSAGGEYTVEQLCEMGGHTPVTVRTMLSDLRSVKYAGKAGVFLTTSVKREDGKTYYSKVAPVAQ